jgi:hypothetical protein
MRPWAAAALAVYAAAAIVVLLAPVSPGRVVELATAFVQQDLGWQFVRQGWIEFGANVALFVPIGFFTTALLRRAWLGFVLGLVISVGAELVQVLLPSRTASLRDVFANALGACIGAAVAAVVLRARARRARR